MVDISVNIKKKPTIIILTLTKNYRIMNWQRFALRVRNQFLNIISKKRFCLQAPTAVSGSWPSSARSCTEVIKSFS